MCIFTLLSFSCFPLVIAVSSYTIKKKSQGILINEYLSSWIQERKIKSRNVELMSSWLSQYVLLAFDSNQSSTWWINCTQRSNKKHWCKFSFTEFRAISAVILVFKVFFVCEFIKIIFFLKKLLLKTSTVQKYKKID
jgi:hypothetical protein